MVDLKLFKSEKYMEFFSAPSFSNDKLEGSESVLTEGLI